MKIEIEIKDTEQARTFLLWFAHREETKFGDLVEIEFYARDTNNELVRHHAYIDNVTVIEVEDEKGRAGPVE